MPKRSIKPKRQPDTQQLARSVLDAVAPDAEQVKAKPEKNPAAVALGRLGGKKGGPARKARLTPESMKSASVPGQPSGVTVRSYPRRAGG